MNETIETHEEKDGGFTLVELLIVIVILGILAAVTVFAVGGITSTARENSCSTEFATVQTAVEAFKADSPTGAAPTSLSVLWAPATGGIQYLREAPNYAAAINAVYTGGSFGTLDCATATPGPITP